MSPSGAAASPAFRVTDAQGRTRGLVVTLLTGTRNERGFTASLLDSDREAIEAAVAMTEGQGVLVLNALDRPADRLVALARHAMAHAFETDGAVLLVRAQSEPTARAFLAAVRADYETAALMR